MSDEQAALDCGRDFLQTIFGHLSTEIDISPRLDADNLIFELTGATESLNRRSDFVSALTLLTSQAVSRQLDRRVNCLLDVDGRLEARRALLATAAVDVGRAVTKNGRRAVFEGLNSSERRVVHTALKEDPGVRTFSEGDERARLLMVEAHHEDSSPEA